MNSHPHPATLGVIGAGRVGRAVTAAVVTTGLVSTILVHSRRRLESIALATDATDLAATQHSPIRIDAVDHPRELRDVTLLVVCVRARFTNHAHDRRSGLLPNAPLVADLAHQFHGFSAPVVMVSNPVDVMSRVFAEHSDTPVLGVGSNLDSARYRTLISHYLAVPLTAVTGSVLGEHGETAVICEHATRIHRHPVQLPLGVIRQQLRERSPRITAGMDRTQHGPAGAVLSTVRKLLGLANGHEELSTISSGGVYLGQRLRFVAGRYRNDPPEHSPAELAALEASRHRLQALYDDIPTHL
ncbi:MAG: lactate/malate family dehydrogenase [Pseudonocardiaceae bacterium]